MHYARCCSMILLSFQFWPMPSMSRGVINCAKQFLSHPFSRIKSFDQWAVDRDPVLTSTTSATIGKTAIETIKGYRTKPKTSDMKRKVQSFTREIRRNSAPILLSIKQHLLRACQPHDKTEKVRLVASLRRREGLQLLLHAHEQ